MRKVLIYSVHLLGGLVAPRVLSLRPIPVHEGGY